MCIVKSRFDRSWHAEGIESGRTGSIGRCDNFFALRLNNNDVRSRNAF